MLGTVLLKTDGSVLVGSHDGQYPVAIRTERIAPAFQGFIVVIYLPEYLYTVYGERTKVMLAVGVVIFVKLREVPYFDEDLIDIFSHGRDTSRHGAPLHILAVFVVYRSYLC